MLLILLLAAYLRLNHLEWTEFKLDEAQSGFPSLMGSATTISFTWVGFNSQHDLSRAGTQCSITSTHNLCGEQLEDIFEAANRRGVLAVRRMPVMRMGFDFGVMRSRYRAYNRSFIGRFPI